MGYIHLSPSKTVLSQGNTRGVGRAQVRSDVRMCNVCPQYTEGWVLPRLNPTQPVCLIDLGFPLNRQVFPVCL